MHRIFLILLGSLFLGSAAHARELPASLDPAPRLVSYSWMSLADWYRFHADDVAQAEAGESPLVFIGDSITEAWETTGEAEWGRHFAPRGAVDLGIGGDMTQNLLWRLDHGAAGKLDPAAVVLLIGVNNLNFSRDTPGMIARGIEAVVDHLEAVFPRADILLLAVFPYAEQPDDPARERVRAINEGIAQLAERPRVTLKDLGDLFLEENGTISAEIMPDYLHLSEIGYKRWAEAILPWVDQRVPLPEAGQP